jgi:hypothetical protein
MKTTTSEQFPSCTFHDVAQRSPAWYDLRKGCLTASNAGEWLTEQPECRMTVPEIKEALDEEGIEYKGKTKRDDLLELLPETRRHLSITKSTEDAVQNAIYKILGQQATVQPPYEFTVDMNDEPPTSPAQWAVWNGLVQEPEAIKTFEWETEKTVIQTGFAKHNEWAAGCSPDGLIAGEPVGYENKSPLPHTHLKYLFENKLPDAYKVQVHFSMAVTGAQAWWFQSFCPGLPTLRILVERDDYTCLVEQGLAQFTQQLEAAQSKLNTY